MATFESRMKEIRLAKGMTQEEMAKFLGYTHKATISMIESGKRSVPLERMKDIAHKLGVDPKWLIGWDGADTVPTALEHTEIRYKKLFDSLNKAGQRKAIEYLKDLAANPNYKK